MNARAFLNLQNYKKQLHPTVQPPNGNVLQRLAQLQTQTERQLRTLVKAKTLQKDYIAAIALLTQIINHNPASAVDYNNRGLMYFESGQMTKAIADYNTALQLNPQLDSAYNNRANYYAAQKLWAKAIADYEMALDLNPVNIRAWINQGITFRELGEYSQALDNFEFALHLGQLTGTIYAERGRTYHLLGDWNCAIADYRRAFALLSPTDCAKTRARVEKWMHDLLNSPT